MAFMLLPSKTQYPPTKLELLPARFSFISLAFPISCVAAELCTGAPHLPALASPKPILSKRCRRSAIQPRNLGLCTVCTNRDEWSADGWPGFPYEARRAACSGDDALPRVRLDEQRVGRWRRRDLGRERPLNAPFVVQTSRFRANGAQC